MGNAVSAQRRHKMTMNTGHTEDGVIFSITFSKYSDGTVILETADITPTWVNDRYQILPAVAPVPPEATEPEATQPSGSEPATQPTEPFWDPKLQESYDRTMAVVGEGLAVVQEYLQRSTAETEALLGVKN